MTLSNIKSMSEIMAFLRDQAKLRSQENDEAGILLQAADWINEEWLALDNPVEDKEWSEPAAEDGS